MWEMDISLPLIRYSYSNINTVIHGLAAGMEHFNQSQGLLSAVTLKADLWSGARHFSKVSLDRNEIVAQRFQRMLP